MRRTRALGIGLFLGMIVCLFLGTSEPVGAANCIESCEAEYSFAGMACQETCNGNQGCLQACNDVGTATYEYCMRHAVYCSTQSYCYAWQLSWSCTEFSSGWWCQYATVQCTGWT
jgi:hypothetical protein